MLLSAAVYADLKEKTLNLHQSKPNSVLSGVAIRINRVFMEVRICTDWRRGQPSEQRLLQPLTTRICVIAECAHLSRHVCGLLNAALVLEVVLQEILWRLPHRRALEVADQSWIIYAHAYVCKASAKSKLVFLAAYLHRSLYSSMR